MLSRWVPLSWLVSSTWTPTNASVVVGFDDLSLRCHSLPEVSTHIAWYLLHRYVLNCHIFALVGLAYTLPQRNSTCPDPTLLGQAVWRLVWMYNSIVVKEVVVSEHLSPEGFRHSSSPQVLVPILVTFLIKYHIVDLVENEVFHGHAYLCINSPFRAEVLVTKQLLNICFNKL